MTLTQPRRARESETAAAPPADGTDVPRPLTLHERIDTLERPEYYALTRIMDKQQGDYLAHDWQRWARPNQRPPQGDWRIWMILAGRGFGKTRAGAEWVRSIAESEPDARIALVAANLAEARSVMVEGPSGLLAIARPSRRPTYEPSLRRLTWPNGARAYLYSAAEPESLRGPEHSHGWCDELGKWDQSGGRAEASWNNLAMGLRRGRSPRLCVTTTPRAVPLVRRLATDSHVAVARGSTFDNKGHLPPDFLAEMERRYGRSLLGRQELGGELIDEVDGALWSRGLIERSRITTLAGHEYARIVIGVDPPASAHGDACGIVVAGLCPDGGAHILADASVEGCSPEGWARAVANAAAAWSADRIVAEANQGGDMVRSVLKAANIALPLRLVHARRGKAARAEPVAALYEAGRVLHRGMFPALEDEYCGLMPGGGYCGPGRSPDRADAAVWALSELMLHAAAPARVRSL